MSQKRSKPTRARAPQPSRHAPRPQGQPPNAPRADSPRGRGPTPEARRPAARFHVAPSSSSSSVLALPASLEQSLNEGHPWIYRDHVPRGFAAESGSWVQLRAGNFQAYALWDATSPIALRVFSRQGPPDQGWFRARIRDAITLRAPLADAGTTAYRLIYGEGDGLPGFTVDLYGRHAVIATYAESVERLVPELVRALSAELSLDGVLQRRREVLESEPRVSLLQGRPPPAPLVVTEHGVRLLADLEAGQKTGLFLDHRENRQFVRGLSAGRSVLNLFSYTGAFSVYAALGGASAVTSVDVSAGAMGAAATNFELNGLPASLHEPVVMDAFAFLESAQRADRRFDVVISDPPSFAASSSKQFAALRAYARLHALCLTRVAAGGLYVAASCTAQVSPEAFRHVLAQAAARVKLRYQLLHDIGQPADHPVFSGHPEGRYLKFVVGRVLPLC